jgi:hypothetical protein
MFGFGVALSLGSDSAAGGDPRELWISLAELMLFGLMAEPRLAVMPHSIRTSLRAAVEMCGTSDDESVAAEPDASPVDSM